MITKVRFLVAFFLMMLFVTNLFPQAENAKYYIEGNYEITKKNGQLVYKLYDITSQNITFAPADTLYAHTNEDETVYFEFEKAATTYPDGFSSGMKFWRWQKRTGEWLEDSEIQNAEQSFSTNKVMSIVLILDCSRSIGSDFVQLQESAIKFVNTISSKASKNNNVHLGLIGFSTMKNTSVIVPLQPLNANTAPKIIESISNMQLGNANGTALYYAMHQGVDMIEQYVSQLRINDGELYDGSSIIAFTDGYDNASLDANIGLPNDDDDMLRTPYFNYLKNQALTQMPNGKPLDSYLIAVKGKDANYDKADFEGAMQELSSSPEQFFPVENFDLLQGEFQKIADKLVDRWKNLNCYVPRSFVGRVRWTLGDVTASQPTPQRPVVSERSEESKSFSMPKLFWGINVGIGFEAVAKFNQIGVIEGFEDYTLPDLPQRYNGYSTFKFAIGFDVGAWIKPNWELGAYLTYYSPFLFSLGLQTQFGDPQGWGGLVGFGYNGGVKRNTPIPENYRTFVIEQRCGYNAFELRAGVRHKNLYAFLNFAIGTWNGIINDKLKGSGSGCIMTLNVGYNFSALVKKSGK